MRTDVSIADHDRVTLARAERTIFGYVWGTVGGTLVLTTVLLLMIVCSSLSPARADGLRVVRGPGKGFYDAASLSGAAAPDIRAYMDRTWFECEVLKVGHGSCNLNASTEAIRVAYVDGYAVALIDYDNDTGNVPAGRTMLWTKRADGHYGILAYADDILHIDDIILTSQDGKLRLSGIIQGPNDTFCCPATKASFVLSYADGKLNAKEVASFSTPKRKTAMEILAGPNPYPAAPMPRRKSQVSGFDFSHNNYAGEAPFVFFHNGSEMMVFPDHGIIAYKQPKDSIADVVHETDILFSGKIEKSGVVGTAYVFKKGCPPLPYRVTGAGYSFDRKDAPPVLVLRGLAPVHARNSCAVIGTTANGPNNVLKFEPAGAYAEDAYEEMTHSGLGYEHATK